VEVYRERGLTNEGQTVLSKEDIDTIIGILTSIETEKVIKTPSTFYEWGYVWQISDRGQKPRIYIPYGTEVRSQDGVTVFKNVTVKVDGLSRDFGDMRDFFGGNTWVSVKLRPGKNTFVVTKDPEVAELQGCKVVKITTTNGGCHHIYMGQKN